MNKEILNAAADQITCFKEKLGETFFDAIMEDANSCYEMAIGIICTFNLCETEKEFKIANEMLMSTCGYDIETLLERIKKRDEENYKWQSLE